MPPSVLRGRLLSSVATSSSRSGEWTDKSVPVGKYSGGEDVDLLPVGGLLARGYACVADQFGHCAPGCLRTNGVYRNYSRRLRDVVMRIAASQYSGERGGSEDMGVRRLVSLEIRDTT